MDESLKVHAHKSQMDSDLGSSSRIVDEKLLQMHLKHFLKIDSLPISDPIVVTKELIFSSSFSLHEIVRCSAEEQIAL